MNKAKATWKGSLKDGKGKMKIGGEDMKFSYKSRFEDGDGTNPEELIGAAHAGCFSMFLSALLGEENLEPTKIETVAKVTLGKDDEGPKITDIELNCEVECDDLTDEKLQDLGQKAKEGCPVSRLYKGGSAEIKLNIKKA